MSQQVLVVDDNRVLADNLAEILTDEGHVAHTAYSGEEALAAAADDCFDLVLSDIRMPGMGGVELITRLHERDPHATYLLMTAYAADRMLDSIHRIGIAGAVLAKPLVIENLLALLRAPTEASVLVVEDDVDLAEVIAEDLRDSGYTTRVAHSFAEARAAITAALPAIALVDIGLPDGDGTGLVRELFGAVEQSLARVPVVFMTGRARLDADELHRLAPGAIRLLRKPFTAETLIKALRSLSSRGAPARDRCPV